MIRENLFHALIQLRHKAKSRTLWVDAICFNQNHIPERNHQVQQMKRVYESAKSTIIWLGQPQPEDRNATELLLEAQEAKRVLQTWMLCCGFPIRCTPTASQGR